MHPADRNGTRSRLPSRAVLALLVAAGCGRDPAFGEAQRVLERFRRALAARDFTALRPLVTERSRPYLEALPAPKGSQPLRVQAAVRRGSRLRLVVEDPNPGAPVPAGEFVFFKERGRWRIDLIATAGRGAREVRRPGPGKPIFVPARLPRRALGRAVEAYLRRRR